MLSVNNVRLKYGAATIVDDISFQVNRGEFLVILGPNGSGKSTLLRALCRLHAPAAGSIELAGRPLKAIPQLELARQLALVRQESFVSFDFTVREVVAMGRLPYLTRWQQESAADLAVIAGFLERTGLGGLSNRKMHELSGGERQRVFLAQALAQQPEVLLLDEPTSHLDINHQVETLELVRQENRDRGLTVIAVLHDLNLAALYADRVLVLHRGRLFASGAPEQVFTADLIEQVYGCKVAIVPHPKWQQPQVLLWPE